MKKLLMLATSLAVFCGVSSASVPVCSSQTLATLETIQGGFTQAGCEIGDKIFTGWNGTFTGADANDTFAFQGPLGTALNPFYNLTLNANTTTGVLGSSLTFGFTVSVDQTQVASGFTSAITRVSGTIQDNGNTGSTSTLVKTIPGCSGGGLTVTDTGNGNVVTSPCTANATSLTVSETYTYTGTAGASSVVGVGNTFTQTLSSTTGTPEPMSMFLFGTGFVAIALLGRKRLARK